MTELHLKHRPRTLSRVVGSEDTIAALEKMLADGTIPHATLFHGPSGCGKTTLARIVKDGLGCHPLDFREINSSSFRGIDSIREIQRAMNLSPAAGPVRVWMLDEVHMLSKDAQNAALKMLEDTPPHVYFMLCTTDPDKLIKAIITRCADMRVRLLKEPELRTLLDRVARKERIELTDRIRNLLIDAADGSARMLLVALEKIGNVPADNRESAIEAVVSEKNESIDLCRAIINRAKWPTVAGILKNLTGEPENVRRGVIGYARSVLLNGNDWNAYNVIKVFGDNLFNSGAAGLAAMCYEVIHDSKD